jgi:SAM-dependent methyltransferase
MGRLEFRLNERTRAMTMTIDASKEILMCTHCASRRPLLDTEVSGRAGLQCVDCGHEFSVAAGVFMMVDKERDEDTLKKFEHQWAVWGSDQVVFGKTSQQYEERYLAEFANPSLDRAWFKGKRTLDAGCGHGIMVEVFDRLGAQSVGLELGDGVFKAAHRLKGRDVTLVQGDILDAPFQPESFDYVYSNGVIHHTRDTRQAFKKLASLVRPGGGLDIWLYPKKGVLWETTMGTGRFFTTKLPPAVLSRLCYLMVPMLYVVPTWSRTSPRTHTVKQCAQVIYDWLSPRYQSHHTFEEVKLWYEEEGFTAIGQIPTTPLSMHGIKK